MVAKSLERTNSLESPNLRSKYEEAVAVQEKIDSYRQQGRTVPLAWIINPFHRKYYVSKGWAQ